MDRQSTPLMEVAEHPLSRRFLLYKLLYYCSLGCQPPTIYLCSNSLVLLILQCYTKLKIQMRQYRKIIQIYRYNKVVFISGGS
jgi:hypothetical protein